MAMEYLLDISGVQFIIRSVRWDNDNVPFNFRPFVADLSDGNTAASLRVENKVVMFPDSDFEPLSISSNDLGSVSLYSCGEDWIVALTPIPGIPPRVMKIDGSFQKAILWINDNDPYYDFVVDSMTRIFFSQYAVSHKGIMLHASVVELDEKGFVFMGESGIGKSTHSRLWTETFDGCRLLNDDCPLVLADGHGGYMVSGTPWSGKTPCYRNKACKVGGIAKLRQSPLNRFVFLDGIEAFVSFIPSMSVITSALELYSEANSTALDLLANVSFGILECRSDREAAILNRSSLDGGCQNLK